MLGNSIVKSIAILCITIIWLYVMWLYANTSLNGWGSTSILVLALLSTVEIMVTATASNTKPTDDNDTK